MSINDPGSLLQGKVTRQQGNERTGHTAYKIVLKWFSECWVLGCHVVIMNRGHRRVKKMKLLLFIVFIWVWTSLIINIYIYLVIIICPSKSISWQPLQRRLMENCYARIVCPPRLIKTDVKNISYFNTKIRRKVWAWIQKVRRKGLGIRLIITKVHTCYLNLLSFLY